MIRYLFSITVLTLAACGANNQAAPVVQGDTVQATEKQGFFPVTAYLKGQVYDIRQKGLTPIKYITTGTYTDSVMIKFDELDGLVKEFLQPEIDSTNLVSLYTESKFLDQTVNAFTFTYDPKDPAADTLQLRHWDVYLDPENGKVKRVYIIKKGGPGKTLQLTWLHNQWFKTTTIITKPDGSTVVEKEEKIVWDY